MFNFKFQQRAFNELNAEQFRVIYLLNSTLSMVNKKNNTTNNDKIEIYNSYLMNKLGLCERQVQRVIKDLQQLGFISVQRGKKSPNIITLKFNKNEV